MTVTRYALTKADSVTIAAIEATTPALAEARALVERFDTMFRRRLAANRAPWITEAAASSRASFAAGVTKAKAAVVAAATELGRTDKPKGRSTG